MPLAHMSSSRRQYATASLLTAPLRTLQAPPDISVNACCRSAHGAGELCTYHLLAREEETSHAEADADRVSAVPGYG